MINKGRRLKRYLGLIRAKPEYYGVIDVISPSMLKGWIVNTRKEEGIKNIGLILNSDNKIIAEVNEFRKDISDTYKIDDNSGFTIYYPKTKPKNISFKNIRVVGINSKGKYLVDMPLLNKSLSVKKLLYEIFSNDIYGTLGNIDGYQNDGFIYGWASKINDSRVINIWMQGKDLPPIKITCDENRDDLTSINIKEKSGFYLDPSSLDDDWFGEKVTFSFDEEGKFNIPQNKDLLIPNYNLSNNIIYSNKNKLNDEMSLSISNDKFNDYSHEMFSEFDLLPQEIQTYLKKLRDKSNKLYEYESQFVKINYEEKYYKKNFINEINKFLKLKK